MAEPLNILHLNTYDRVGGAARAAWRVHEGLLAKGYQSRFIARFPLDDNHPLVCRPALDMAPRYRVQRQWRVWHRRQLLRPHRTKLKQIDGHFDLAQSNVVPVDWRRELEGVDFVNIHWVSNYLDWPSFFAQIPPSIPILWTLHDMAPLTGGCHHSAECTNYITGCHKCPLLASEKARDLSYVNWHAKHAALANLSSRQMGIIGPSSWMADRSRESSLFSRFEARHIPNGLDLDSFYPLDRATCRRALGVQRDDLPLVLFSAASLVSPYKGWTKLAEALSIIRRRGIKLGLLLMGNQVSSVAASIPEGIELVFQGNVSQHALMQVCLSAADVTVVPSKFENLPCIIQESMACGTPVVGFAVGGIREMIQPGYNGQLAQPGDPEDLAEKLMLLISQTFSDEGATRRHCRETAEAKWSLETQATAYTKFYEDLLSSLR